MTRIIGLVQVKGGAGRSTVRTNLAGELSKLGKTVLIDFAHNPDGFEGVRDYLATVKSPMKIGIIVGTGDRLDSDLIRNGELAAEMFDHIIIQQKKFYY